MALRTALTKVIFPALFKSFPFQDASFRETRSTTYSKSQALGRPWRIGKPKYFSKCVVKGIEVILRMRALKGRLTPPPAKALDFATLTLKPDAAQKSPSNS